MIASENESGAKNNNNKDTRPKKLVRLMTCSAKKVVRPWPDPIAGPSTTALGWIFLYAPNIHDMEILYSTLSKHVHESFTNT